MADKKQKSEPEFIRGTVLASILLLLIFIAAGVVFARNPDAVRGAAAVNSLGQLVSSNKSITAENAQLLLELIIGTVADAQHAQPVFLQLRAEMPVGLREIRGNKDEILHLYALLCWNAWYSG